MKNIFAQRLKELMARTKTTQVELAKKLGITRQSVSQYLNGDVIPNVEKLYLIADFFDVSSDYLIGRREDRKIKTAQLLVEFAKVIADRCRLDKIFSNAFNNCFETELTMRLFEKIIITMAVMFADDMDNQIECQSRLKNEIESELMYLETHKVKGE